MIRGGSKDPPLRGALARVEELAARALEALVQWTSDVWRHRPEPHPLRLRAAYFLLIGSPARFLVFGGTTPARHRVGGQTFTQLLRQQFGGREIRGLRRLRGDDFLDARQ